MSKADLLVGELPCDLQDVQILGSPRSEYQNAALVCSNDTPQFCRVTSKPLCRRAK
jgi:hypothetical protein